MIVQMCRVRILGRARDRIAVVGALQDFRGVQLATPHERLERRDLDDKEKREARLLRHAVEDVEAALRGLGPVRGPVAASPSTRSPIGAKDIAAFARLGRNVRRALDRIDTRVAAAEDERALLSKYRALFATFAPILARQESWPGVTAYHVLLEPSARGGLGKLRDALTLVLRDALGDAFELRTQRLRGGEIAVLVLLPRSRASSVEHALADARVRELPIPTAYGAATLADAIPRMLTRLQEIPEEIASCEDERSALRDAHGEPLRRAREVIVDRLDALDAMMLAATTEHAFVLEGWVPAKARAQLGEHLHAAVDESITIETIPRTEWAEEPPVALQNPRAFRPFEVLLRPLPLPRYGTIDPTPLLALFFPFFFGLMLGDIGYGALLLAGALALRVRARAGSARRTLTTIASACAASAIAFGFLFGELFGNLGHRLVGLEPLLVHRGERIHTMLGLAVGIGLVHIELGLIVGAVSAARRDRRQAIARGISALMVLLTATIVVALAGALPSAVVAPTASILALCTVALIATAGIVGPVELVSTLGNVLSYARLMALGTASVTVALVANHFIGDGDAVAGIVAAILLHLVNFVLGVFSPTIHALRLHYVELFGKFFEPGGTRFHPFGHASTGP